MKYPIALMLLMLADAMSTMLLVRTGKAVEANPLMASLLGISTIGFIGVKGLVGFLGGLALNACPKSTLFPHINVARRTIILIMVGVLFWHIICWLAV